MSETKDTKAMTLRLPTDKARELANIYGGLIGTFLLVISLRHSQRSALCSILQK